MNEENSRYLEWLLVISNTRLLFNTSAEMEKMLDAGWIHNNGMKRYLSTPQRERVTFRDMRVEVELMTGGRLSLENVMEQYHRAWLFYRKNLNRRVNPEQVALKLLAYCYPPFCRKRIGAKLKAIFEQVVECGINVPILVLLLMKAIPGYESRLGDVTDIHIQFERVIGLLEQFVASNPLFSVLPALIRAREENLKTRIMLLYHVDTILDVYESYSGADNTYRTVDYLKCTRVNPDIAGYWNECGGELQSTTFWQIEESDDCGIYFLTHWRKDADNKITGIRYSMSLNDFDDGKLIVCVMHPEAIDYLVKGRKLDDRCQVWYQTELIDGVPTNLPLERAMSSTVWPSRISLTRCTSPEVNGQYEQWLHHDCKVVKPFGNFEFKFYISLYAITPTHLYVRIGDDEYFKIPKSANEGFARITIDDNVGLLVMNETMYLAFDELLLYIPTDKKTLKRYGIERVSSIT